MPSPNHRNLPSIDCPLHIVEVWPERFAVRREFGVLFFAPVCNKLLHVSRSARVRFSFGSEPFRPLPGDPFHNFTAHGIDGFFRHGVLFSGPVKSQKEPCEPSSKQSPWRRGSCDGTARREISRRASIRFEKVLRGLAPCRLSPAQG